MRRLLSLFVLNLLAALPALAVQIGDLPGEDVSTIEVRESKEKANSKDTVPKERRNNNWLAPSVEEQLARERTLIPLGKGAVFVPTYSESRREPEVSVFSPSGRQVKSGQTGQRILLDSGSYTLRIGSGTKVQQIPVKVRVEEGHTAVVEPDWGGLIVETLTGEGEYIDGQYEVIRMEKWINYGKGHGLKEERLQDIKAWILPPGLYRISKPGEGFNSLRNYITVQINPGELSHVEVIYDKVVGGDIISGGLKALNARLTVGRNWSYGLRAGGNVNLTRKTDDAGIRQEGMQVFSDLRLRALYDNIRYLGTSELLLQDNFSKERGRRFSVTSDIAELRTTWIRRLNNWLGPYVRGTVDTRLFPIHADKDTVLIETMVDSSGTMVRRTVEDTGGSFLVAPSFDPINLREGIGVNIEFISKYYLEATAQAGFGGRQTFADGSYTANPEGNYELTESTNEIGAEGTLNSTMRLGSQVTLDLRLEMFAPNANFYRLRLDDLSADFRFFLSRNLEVGYLYQVKEKVGAKYRFPSSHSLSLRLSFNY
ncbi:MAG: ABC-type uncharacterized transport system, auxiliary component [Fibrobacteres bacterium]|nr:ABC-type uncharacterized transport system, auxiliary component [Fibrobacterota bacterium]